MMIVGCAQTREASDVSRTGSYVISLRRMTLGSGYRYLMESVATGDGAVGASSSLTRYYAESGTPPGVFLGAGLAALDGGRGIEKGSAVTEHHLFNLLGMCADPVTGVPLGRQPNRFGLVRTSTTTESAETDLEIGLHDKPNGPVDAAQRTRISGCRKAVAGFDLTFSPSKSVSVAWALADPDTKAQIYACHRQAIEIVLSYAEREVFCSRSGTNGVVQEDVEGVVAVAFTHWDSRAGDPQLHDHVVVANRARSRSDGKWRTLDSRGLFKSVVALSELHQGVLSDLLTGALGWGWEGTTRRHSERLRFEVAGVGDALMAEFSQRAVAIEGRKNALVAEFAAARGRQPTSTEVLDLRQRATLETRPAKEHRSLAAMTAGWRRRAESYVGSDQMSWVAGLADRNDLPLLRAGDLAEGILADAAGVAVQRVAERRATFSRANLLAEVHRQLHAVRFASPTDRIAVAEHTTDMAVAQSLLISAPELHHTPEHLRRADGTSRFRAKGHEIYTTVTLLDAESRLLDAGRRTDGPAVSIGVVATKSAANLPGRDHPLNLDQAMAVEQIATSGRALDVLVGPAGTGKSTTMAGLRAVWEAEHGPGSVLGLAPSAAAAEVLAGELGIDTENTAKWLYEHRQEPARLAELASLRRVLRSAGASKQRRLPLRRRIAAAEEQLARWRLRRGQLVIVEEATLAGTFALDELVSAAGDAGAKVLLVGDPAQLSAVEAGGTFATLVRDRDGLAPELSDVRRFHHAWERNASVQLRAGSEDAIGAYEAHDRIASGERAEMLDAVFAAWKRDVAAGRTSLMIAGDLGTVSELNDRARAERISAGQVVAEGVSVAGGGTAGVGDEVRTRQNNRRLMTGRSWVRNGDRWSVIATSDDGSMTVERSNGAGVVLLPVDYVREHVELAYASTAHRAQGRTVDTAHALVSPTTTREVLYVSGTRGREGNWLYVDTRFDPDPQTSHDEVTEPASAREVLAGVVRNEGADMAAHEMIRRAQSEAESFERLSAEYLTLATAAQAERWDTLLEASGLTSSELDAVRSSEAHSPLLAAFREADAAGLDIEAAFPHLVAIRSLSDADDEAAVLHARVHRWIDAARGMRRGTEYLVAGLIPRARGVADRDMARALTDREQSMESRARMLAVQAIEAGHDWVRRLGPVPDERGGRARWLRDVSTIAAYRDRWHVTGTGALGSRADVKSIEQMGHFERALSAEAHARAMTHALGASQMTTAYNIEREALLRAADGQTVVVL
jgi:conjugative relaxase-like TrwC/TraI family protein